MRANFFGLNLSIWQSLEALIVGLYCVATAVGMNRAVRIPARPKPVVPELTVTTGAPSTESTPRTGAIMMKRSNYPITLLSTLSHTKGSRSRTRWGVKLLVTGFTILLLMAARMRVYESFRGFPLGKSTSTF